MKNIPSNFSFDIRLVEEIILEVPMEQRQWANDYIFDNGYHFKESGPKPLPNFSFDMNTYQVKGWRLHKGNKK